MKFSDNPFDRHFLDLTIVRYVDFNSQHFGQFKLPLHEFYNSVTDIGLQGQECLCSEQFVILANSRTPKELSKQCPYSGYIHHVLYRVTGNTSTSSLFIGDYYDLQSAEAIVYRLKTESGMYSASWQISRDHLPLEVFEKLLDYAEAVHPSDYSSLNIEMYPIPYRIYGTFDGLCIRFKNTPWSEEMRNNLRQNFMNLAFDQCFVDLIMLAGQAGVEILIIEGDSKVLDGLKTYSSDSTN